MIDRITAERIKDAADIVDVVRDYVTLQRSGSNYKALCPFHNERTPSFSINPKKNFCYCFSCKKGGSPVNFLMQKEGFTYEEALRNLAKRYGIQIEERELTAEEREKRAAREAILIANEWAMKKMEDDLFNTEEGRNVGLQYFRHRGITDEAIKAFHLGYALEKGNQLAKAARSAGFNLEHLRVTGLLSYSEDRKQYYDQLRGRVIFPFISQSRQVVGFGGRTLKKDDVRKYINSTDSIVYQKKHLLYGISQAREAIIKEDKSFLVEGYMDVIGMWQSGLRNVVASSGTALTEGQIMLLKRYSNKITLIYDGDAAGIKASVRGIEMLLEKGMMTKVLLLPDGHDPDSFAREHTPEEFRAYVAEHETDIVTYLAKALLGEGTPDAVRLGDVVRQIVSIIAKIPDRIQRDIYVKEVARVMDMPIETIAEVTGQARTRIEFDERQRRQRERQQELNGPQDNQGGNPGGDQEVVQEKNEVQQQTSGNPYQTLASPNPLYPLERSVISYLVRYGMLTVGTVEDDQGNEVEVNVLEFARMELEMDDMTFKDPAFTKLWHRIQELATEFPERRVKRAEKIENEISVLRKQGYDEIAVKNLDMAAIGVEEKLLEQRLADYRLQLEREYARSYIERNLYDDEDNEIRTLVNSFMMEPYQLSNIYLKNGNNETDEDRLHIIVPRAILEWKNEWLELRLKDVCNQLEKCNEDDEETTRRLQIEITEIISVRSELARRTGDRILAPLGRWIGKEKSLL